MKKTLLCLLGLMAMTSCRSTTEADFREPVIRLDTPVEVTLAVGESRAVGNTALHARFLGILEDSRCPVDATCVWEGNAAAEIQLSVGDQPATTARINTSLEPRSVDFGAVSFTVVELTPVPRQTAPIESADYRITLRFTQR